MESFSIELIEVIIRKFSKRNVFAKYCKYLKYNLKYNTNTTIHQNTTSDNRVYFG